MAPTGKTPDYSKLSDRQREILTFIRTKVIEQGYPPSIREIGHAVSLRSSSSVKYQLDRLEELGFLHRDPNRPRAVDVHGVERTNTSSRARSRTSDSAQQIPEGMPMPQFVPLVGTIAAGAPITAEEHVESFFPLPQEFMGSGDFFMLKVKGESMIDAAICDGDFVVIRAQRSANNGDFVAALIEGEATVKEFRQDSTGAWLLPHNALFDPIPATHAEIMGKVVMNLRQY